MGKRLVLRRGGLAVIDAEAGNDWGNANSIGHDAARLGNVQMVNGTRAVEAICAQDSYDAIREKHAGGSEVAMTVNVTAECNAYRGRGDRYILLLDDVGPDRKGAVLLTPAPAAEIQIHQGIARYAEPWEIIACAVDVPLPVFGESLKVAHYLHAPDDSAVAVPGGSPWN